MKSGTINWEQLVYDASKASRDFEVMDQSLDNPAINLSQDKQNLRLELIEARDELYEKLDLDGAERLGYKFDLHFGLCLYEILNPQNGFTTRVASNDTVWRYLSLKVIPDIVHSRWGKKEARFFGSRRIWLKNIWWYIHLSWAGDVSSTYELLKDNSTDTVAQLVERPGLGYYTELYREIMKQYATVVDRDRNLFRNALKLNTTLLPVTLPELMDGGIPEYVRYLFAKVQ